MIAKDLLDILACPETKKDLALAESGLVQRVNAAVESGRAVNRAGKKVTEPLEGGLHVKESNPQYLYPIRKEIPILLIDEAIVLASIS